MPPSNKGNKRTKLNIHQRLFVRQYLIDKNASRAYRAVYGDAKSGPQSACVMLKNPKIAREIEKQIAKEEAMLEITAERTKRRLAEFAYQPLTAQELKSKAGSNALKAIELLAKHFKLLTDVQEVTCKDGQPQVILTLTANGSESIGPSDFSEIFKNPEKGERNKEEGNGGD